MWYSFILKTVSPKFIVRLTKFCCGIKDQYNLNLLERDGEHEPLNLTQRSLFKGVLIKLNPAFVTCLHTHNIND